MEQVNLKKYRVTTVEDALAVLEEAGDTMVTMTNISHDMIIID